MAVELQGKRFSSLGAVVACFFSSERLEQENDDASACCGRDLISDHALPYF